MVVRPLIFGLVGTTALALVMAAPDLAHAQTGTREAQIVVDTQTNEVLYENNAQAARRPASITKVMTLYLLFDSLKKGEISWDDRIVFSRNAANQPPTKLFVGAGNSISVQTAVEALVLRSANDVATAVAERLGGSESNFAQRMTNKARELGMSSTTFRNASGLPNATQRTTAEDLARLAIAIHRDFPDQYHWFSAQQMSYNGQIITGHNHVMKRVAGMDGLKTGYTAASGFNLAATTQRNGRRIVTVVLGGANRFQRDDLVEALTESAYQELGIGTTQFAYNTTAYEVNFRDARDAADAAALVMDLPPRPVTMGGISSIAMARSGRRIGFERGAPTFQVADMTRRPEASRVISGRGAQMAQREDNETGPTDDGEEDVVRTVASSASTPAQVRFGAPVPVPVPVPAPVFVPVPTPFRVAVAPSAVPTPTPARNRPMFVPVPNSVPVPSSVPVTFASVVPPVRSVAVPTPVPSPAPTPVTPTPAPLRQLAQLEEIRPAGQVVPEAVAPNGAEQDVTSPPSPLRGSLDTATVAPTSTDTQTTPPIALPSPPVQPTQMAELLAATPSPTQVTTEQPQPQQMTPSNAEPTAPVAQVAEVAEAAPTSTPQVAEASKVPEVPTTIQPTQMAELAAKDAADLATPNAQAAAEGQLNGNINLADGTPAATPQIQPAQRQTPPTSAAPTDVPTQMAVLNTDAVAQAQQRQAEANAREQGRIADAAAIENTRREAARVQAAAAARVLAERQANERRAERQLAETRAKALKEKEARDLAQAERLAVQERAVAAREEERRQAEATRARNARGTAVVQVGAFKDRKDAMAAISRFSRFFPSFAQTEVSSVSRRDGVWYRARFAGVGTSAAGEACRSVLGRGGVCEIVGR